MLRRLCASFAALTLVGAASALAEDAVAPSFERLEAFPTAIKLTSARAEATLAITGIHADGHASDATRLVQLASSNEAIVKVEAGRVVPVANGTCEIRATSGDKCIAIPVEVAGHENPPRVSFQHGALVALSKQSCNTGACHGSPSGKGGFRLSLRAYDPVLDTETLVRESFNRRTNVLEPEQSLLLRKPLMEVAHGGGRRLKKTDPSYQLLRDWIAEGMPADPADAPACVGIDIYPRQRTLVRPAQDQQMVAIARFSDGTQRDVTRLAIYSSSDEAVATVDENGLVTALDRGETAVLVRYLEHVETSYLTFLRPLESFAWQAPAERNFIDALAFAKLKQLEILPSDLCTDDEFIRRAFLDVIGQLPSPMETIRFLTDSSPDKRARWIDALLERPEYADYWALKWSDLLRVNNKQVTAAGVHKYRRWIHATVRDNVPYDQFARRLLTSSGNTFDNPPANFYRAAIDTNDCVETTSQLFLGIRIQCAKCHNHPFERWTQDNYYGIGAFFNRVQRKPSPKAEEQIVFVARAGEVTQPRTGKQMKPWLPLVGDAEMPGEDDRRQAFVDWLVSADNPFFAAAQVNRLWGHVMGRGIVEPVDDFRASNPPSNAPLLEALAKDFVAHGYDQKHTLRTILNSATYQLSARSNTLNKNDTKYFSHARTRLLTAEQLLDGICKVTDVVEKYPGLPTGTRATQLPSPDVNHYFLKVFGQPPREMACQCERSTESNLSQALQMINGPLVHEKLRHEQNRLRKLAKDGKDNDEIVTELYLAAFCRAPSEAELAAARQHMAGQADRLQGLEDVCWAVLNAKEFLFQH